MRKPRVHKLGIILEPSRHSFENRGVLNPGCFQEGKYVHLFYRAIDSNYRSSIGYAKLEGPTKVVERWSHPIITRDFKYEKEGVEDPRIVKIGDTFYMTYIVHDGKNALTAYATSSDLKKFRKRGIISPKITYHQAKLIFRNSKLKDAYFFYAAYYEEEAGKDVYLWHKDVVLFPKKFKGRFAFIHRILPDIQIAFCHRFSELRSNFWRRYLKRLSKYVILENTHWFETRNIGGGAPPLLTDKGWLLIYHTVEAANRGRVYHATAALLDSHNPMKVLGKLHQPLFSPTLEWERKGLVNNVVFPTGLSLFGDKLYIYYGAADTRVGVAVVSLAELLRELLNPKRRHNYGQRKKFK